MAGSILTSYMQQQCIKCSRFAIGHLHSGFTAQVQSQGGKLGVQQSGKATVHCIDGAVPPTCNARHSQLHPDIGGRKRAGKLVFGRFMVSIGNLGNFHLLMIACTENDKVTACCQRSSCSNIVRLPSNVSDAGNHQCCIYSSGQS